MVKILKVPFYAQSLDFSCGPACVMMAVAYFKGGYPLTKVSEIEIWREATLHETRGTCRYGLALSAWNRGLDAGTLATTKGIPYMSKIQERYKDLDVEFMMFLFEDLRNRCAQASIRDELGKVDMGAIGKVLDRGEVPILLCSTAMFSSEDIPHWIIVTGVEGDIVHVNNPLSDGPETVGVDRFSKYMGWKGEGAMISISERKDRSQKEKGK